MASETCMNALCGAATTSVDCRRGWALRSGESAALCDECSYAYEHTIFCDMFHSKDSGWRECTSCGKRLHCGCIVSVSLLELLEGGGIKCVNCAASSGLQPRASDKKPNGFDMSKAHNDLQSTSVDNHSNGAIVDKIKFMHLNSNTGGVDLRHLIQWQKDDRIGSFGKKKKEDSLASAGETSACFSNFSKASRGSSQFFKLAVGKSNMGAKDVYEPLAQTSLNITLGNPITNASAVAAIDERESSRISSSFQRGSKSHHLTAKPQKPAVATSMEANGRMVSQIRVARPPAEGCGRSQLLPRYWPRITDQELQQISGDSNSTIVPLFEKILSASDAGRIGRLVLPKACAEAYFPPISQPEGLSLRIQDIKGKEWVFQFRFWPNNNSRMYVLEGVTPCIQSMQLQAGDTVTFSRMEPGGKLVMGFRKASNSVGMQETKPSAIPNGPHSSEAFFSGGFENQPITSGYSGLLQSLKGSTDPHLHALSKHLNSNVTDVGGNITEKHDGWSLSAETAPERKRARNIGSKSKRLLIDSQDALELKLTWEEAQDLLRPPPIIKPSIAKIEDHEFEEYEEPPIFGKSSIFGVGSTGGQEQWAQCDSCMKWRRLPVDFLLPAKWTCVDNYWDQSRCSCSAPDELTSRELENLLRLNNEFKKRRIAASQKAVREHEASGLDALANATILGDNVGDPGATISVAKTTKHPRHRPGCSCIVCIQPPSGKGRHNPTCTCNVCMTVKRRFKTLMIRKRKCQLEREAETAQRNQHAHPPNDEADVDNTSAQASPPPDSLESKSQSNNVSTVSEAGKGLIDLNFQPDREEELQHGTMPHITMTGLLQVANLPLETYMKQNGLTSLVSEQPATEEGDRQPQENLNDGEDRENGAEDHCDTEKLQSTL